MTCRQLYVSPSMTQTFTHACFQTHPDAMRIDPQRVSRDAQSSRKLLATLNPDPLIVFIVGDDHLSTLCGKTPETTFQTSASFSLIRIVVNGCGYVVRLLDVQMSAIWIPERLSFHQLGHALNISIQVVNIGALLDLTRNTIDGLVGFHVGFYCAAPLKILHQPEADRFILLTRPVAIHVEQTKKTVERFFSQCPFFF